MLLNLILKILKLPPANKYHPLVYVGGRPQIGSRTYIGLFSEINATGGEVMIGRNCDIASFVSINCADSHKKCIGLSRKIDRGKIILGDCVFVGSHSFIGGNIEIQHHSVIAAGSVIIGKGEVIPPYSLIIGNPYKVKVGHYAKNLDNLQSPR
jgi:acetyltransferase-like isoleucine patch superfamily enzyme